VCAKFVAVFEKGKAKLISMQTDKISQQPENWKNRNNPDLVQALTDDCYYVTQTQFL
jgi:hypothetical protein